ncbi:MAG: alpha/beta hydrolase [Deltaproteobacteria bacterium]|nr:alpha/beta hydrolase [Deltaproteobacteria bacterium]
MSSVRQRRAAAVVVVVVAAVFAALQIWPTRALGLALWVQARAAGLSPHVDRVDDHDVAYFRGGHGPIVLLLHGFGASKEDVVGIARALVPYHTVVIPDLPGFGASSRVSSASYDLEAEAERVERFAQVLDLGPVDVVGHSLGGMLAGLLAARHPERVRSISLLGSGGAGGTPSAAWAGLERGEQSLIVRDLDDLEGFLKLCFAQEQYFPGFLRRGLVGRLSAHADFTSKILSDLVTGGLRIDDDDLALIKVPTLLVFGRQDALVDLSVGEAWSKALPQARFVVVEDCGHALSLECPEQVLPVLRSFLAR